MINFSKIYSKHYLTRSSKGSDREAQQETEHQTKWYWIVLASVFLNGCVASRTVFVPEDSPMRVGPNNNVVVYTYETGEWVLSENRIKIPEGWYIVPPSFVKEE